MRLYTPDPSQDWGSGRLATRIDVVDDGWPGVPAYWRGLIHVQCDWNGGARGMFTREQFARFVCACQQFMRDNSIEEYGDVDQAPADRGDRLRE